MEIWKMLRVSHIPTPPTTTTDKCPTRRYTNTPFGTKDRSGHRWLRRPRRGRPVHRRTRRVRFVSFGGDLEKPIGNVRVAVHSVDVNLGARSEYRCTAFGSHERRGGTGHAQCSLVHSPCKQRGTG